MSEQNLISRVISDLNYRRERIIDGKINCIPSPFKRFSDDFVGVEQGCYYVITGGTKTSKTQIMNFLFLYNAVLYAYNNPEKLRVKILYYPLEETQEAITTRFICFLLYTLTKGRIRISPKDLRSTRSDNPVSLDILEEINKPQYQDILKFFEEHVQFIPDRNATGIHKQARLYAENNGTTYYKTLEIKDKQGNVIENRKVFDYYVPDDPDEYVLIIIDHIS